MDFYIWVFLVAVAMGQCSVLKIVNQFAVKSSLLETPD
jgi:hypothetical protein